MGERLLCKQEVIGSNPFTSTIRLPFGFALGAYRGRIPGGIPGVRRHCPAAGFAGIRIVTSDVRFFDSVNRSFGLIGFQALRGWEN